MRPAPPVATEPAAIGPAAPAGAGTAVLSPGVDDDDGSAATAPVVVAAAGAAVVDTSIAGAATAAHAGARDRATTAAGRHGSTAGDAAGADALLCGRVRDLICTHCGIQVAEGKLMNGGRCMRCSSNSGVGDVTAAGLSALDAVVLCCHSDVATNAAGMCPVKGELRALLGAVHTQVVMARGDRAGVVKPFSFVIDACSVPDITLCLLLLTLSHVQGSVLRTAASHTNTRYKTCAAAVMTRMTTRHRPAQRSCVHVMQRKRAGTQATLRSHTRSPRALPQLRSAARQRQVA